MKCEGAAEAIRQEKDLNWITDWLLRIMHQCISLLTQDVFREETQQSKGMQPTGLI